MKKIIMFSIMTLCCMGIAWATVTMNVNINGADFANDVTATNEGNVEIINATIPIQNGANVRSVNINLQNNSMMVQTNAE